MHYEVREQNGAWVIIDANSEEDPPPIITVSASRIAAEQILLQLDSLQKAMERSAIARADRAAARARVKATFRVVR